jgi:hypothetical protein
VSGTSAINVALAEGREGDIPEGREGDIPNCLGKLARLGKKSFNKLAILAK